MTTRATPRSRPWGGCAPTCLRRSPVCRGATPASATSCSATTSRWWASSTGSRRRSAAHCRTSGGGCRLDEHHSTKQGVTRLEGLGTRDETIDFWEQRVGRPVDREDLHWHEVFAAFKLMVIGRRVGKLGGAGPLMPKPGQGFDDQATLIDTDARHRRTGTEHRMTDCIAEPGTRRARSGAVARVAQRRAGSPLPRDRDHLDDGHRDPPDDGHQGALRRGVRQRAGRCTGRVLHQGLLRRRRGVPQDRRPRRDPLLS